MIPVTNVSIGPVWRVVLSQLEEDKYRSAPLLQKYITHKRIGWRTLQCSRLYYFLSFSWLLLHLSHLFHWSDLRTDPKVTECQTAAAFCTILDCNHTVSLPSPHLNHGESAGKGIHSSIIYSFLDHALVVFPKDSNYATFPISPAHDFATRRLCFYQYCTT